MEGQNAILQGLRARDQASDRREASLTFSAGRADFCRRLPAPGRLVFADVSPE